MTIKFKFRALFAYDDAEKTFEAAERGEGGLIVEFTAASMAEANHIVGKFLDTHRNIDSEIDFVAFDPIVQAVETD